VAAVVCLSAGIILTFASATNAAGERDVTAVDSDAAVDRELRLRVELHPSACRQKRRTQQDV